MASLKELKLNELDFNDVGSWPLPVKIGAIALVGLALLFAGYWFDTKQQLANLDVAKTREAELKTDFEAKAHKAINLDLYKQQMAEMERSFGAMLRQLPSQTEVAELLADISQTGLANGLEFDLFKPKDEIPAEFYAELPIQVKVTGVYHEFGAFVSAVAALPRIVTLHDISISPAQAKEIKGSDMKSDKGVVLVMEATAKTYRYIEEQAK